MNNIRKKRKIKIKLLFIFNMTIIGIVISYKMLDKSKIKITDKEIVNLIVDSSFDNKSNFIDKLVDTTLKYTNPIKLLSKDYDDYISTSNTNDNNNVIEDDKPIIYLYNSHQTEEYSPSNYAEFSVNPTVIVNNYILEDIFNKNNYKTIVEERSIKDILNSNNWNYASSYKASRVYMEDIRNRYPSLKYFIDIHRDSLDRNKTYINIEGRDYAKLIFLIGLENPNYRENLEFTEKINNKLNEYYPGLSKGIYKKEGPGVNGVYNQDFSKYTILIEVGGVGNTTLEVLNSSIAFSKCFLEVINEEHI